MRYSVFANNCMRGVYTRHELLQALIEADKVGGHVFDWHTWRPVALEEALEFLEKKRGTLLFWVAHKRKQEARRKGWPRLAIVAGT